MLSDGNRGLEATPQYQKELNECIDKFTNWNDNEQVDFVELLLSRMCHYQHGHINSYLKPMLKRDFISLLPKFVANNILSFLDADSLTAAELVSTEWERVITEGMLWKKLIERKVRSDSLWRGLAERKEWIKNLFVTRPGEKRSHSFYRQLYPVIMTVSLDHLCLDVLLIFRNFRTSIRSRITGAQERATYKELTAVQKTPRACTASNTTITKSCRAYVITPSRFGIEERFSVKR